MSKKTKATAKKWFVGFEVREVEYFWLQYQAKLRGQSLENMCKEGLTIIRGMDEDLLNLGWLTSLKKQVYFGPMAANALRAYLKLPQKRLQKTEKVEMKNPVDKQIEELRAKMRRRKPLKQSKNDGVAAGAIKILDKKSHIEKVVKKKIAAGDE